MPGIVQPDEPEHGSDEMDTHIGACKRPLSVSSQGNPADGDENDLEWIARFYDSTIFPSNFLEEEDEDLTPCIPEQSHIPVRSFTL